MSRFISRLHAELRALRPTGRGADWSAPAPVGEHKEYARFPRIMLPARAPLTMTLTTALEKRASFSTAPIGEGFTEAELGTLLGHSLGRRRGTLRTYPSGGGLYPVESYIVGSVVAGKPRGAYHYHPRKHALEHLWEAPQLKMSDILRTPAAPIAETLLVFTAEWRKSSRKYGDWARDHAILEAGHMAQNVLLVATAMGLRARPVLGFDDDSLATLLDVPESEQVVYGVLLARESGSADTESYE